MNLFDAIDFKANFGHKEPFYMFCDRVLHPPDKDYIVKWIWTWPRFATYEEAAQYAREEEENDSTYHGIFYCNSGTIYRCREDGTHEQI